MSDNLSEALKWLVFCAAVAFVINGMSSCQARVTEAEEKTDQEAIRAGLIQGEYGRWRKP